MFRINRRTDYAVRVMLCLAKRTFGTRLPTQAIQDEMQIPRAFLQRIIADLSKAELIQTYPGPNGGVQMGRPAHHVNLRHIWEAIEGPFLISECIQKPQDCPLNTACPVCSHWTRLQCLITREMDSVHLDQLAEEAWQIVRKPGNSILPTGMNIATSS